MYIILYFTCVLLTKFAETLSTLFSTPHKNPRSSYHGCNNGEIHADLGKTLRNAIPGENPSMKVSTFSIMFTRGDRVSAQREIRAAFA